ncbi:LLM class flavin-dependent oxidoreductase [Paenibacillus sp. LMG 31461]|uniref:LLM class flavin-dependent oxidoreductase n=1 Tax=Paenibacillus plantarum TaxID=2654975 RepID=A0ABX1X6L8_9BACL|nr:LLM class flavin-dependent oxidoreductase [Paenibacillus plantarum]NOU64075.1 LLM class flavin-dependent oxidoreductase [Paenibacillus plantarum]
MASELRFFSEIPSWLTISGEFGDIENISKLSEKYNFYGSLIYFFNNSFDPWILTTKVLNNTDHLVPLIAVQPYYMPPVTSAKIIKSIATLYKRKVCLNFVTGVYESEIKAMYESIDPKTKYARLREYINVVYTLLMSDKEVNFHGDYYKFSNLDARASIPTHLMPEIFIPGSSDESILLAQDVADTALLRPHPIELFKKLYLPKIEKKELNLAIRISIITRDSSEKAWEIANSKYIQDRHGKMITKIRGKSSSHNTKLMANLALSQEIYDDVYWMGAYLSGNKVDDPYIVGSYSDVSNYLCKYMDLGVRTFLIGNIDETNEEAEHISEIMKRLKTYHTLMDNNFLGLKNLNN